MDNSSQRKILRVSPEWETPKLAGEITSALAGNGPILGFGEITSGFAPVEVAVVIGTSGTTGNAKEVALTAHAITCLLYTSPSPRDGATSRMPSSA